MFGLRHNYATMVELKEAVYQADRESGDVKAALSNLQNYVYHHMNTSLASGSDSVYPPIQLKYTYDRLVQARGNQTAQTNAAVYTKAQNYCEARLPANYYARDRVGCIQDYVKKLGFEANAAPIPESLYKFDFVSAKWSPDLAGWSLVAVILSGLGFIVTFLAGKWLKYKAK